MDELSTELKTLVEQEMVNCIGCNNCMAECPVSKSPDLTIPMLNQAVLSDSPPKGIVRDFVLNCVQCSRCVPICPPGVRRDLMVLITKSKITSYPSNYDNYVRLKQPNPPAAMKIAYNLKKRGAKKKLGNLYEKLDPENPKPTEVLFYPGCYIFNEVCHKTTAILDYLGIDYDILGGYSTCCGWPQLLQGRIDMAEEFMEHLWELIQKISPKLIITSCAECYAALRKIKAIKNASYIAQTTTDFFYEHRSELPLQKITEKSITLHDSCHISRKYRKSETPRELIKIMGNLVEMSNHHDHSMCCYYYNFENDANNTSARKNRLEEAVESGAGMMVTDCITCNEVYSEKITEKPVKIWDINEMVYHCIKLQQKEEPSHEKLKEN